LASRQKELKTRLLNLEEEVEDEGTGDSQTWKPRSKEKSLWGLHVTGKRKKT